MSKPAEPAEPYKIRPTLNRVLLRRKEGAATMGRFIVPDTVREKPQEALVIAVGPQVTDIKVGMTVMFMKYAGTEVKSPDGNGVLLMMTEDDIVAEVKS